MEFAQTNLHTALAICKQILTIYNETTPFPALCVERFEKYLNGEEVDMRWEDVPREDMPVGMAMALAMAVSIPEASTTLASIIYAETEPEGNGLHTSYREGADSICQDSFEVDDDNAHTMSLVGVFNTLDGAINYNNTNSVLEGLIYSLSVLYPLVMGEPCAASSGIYGTSLATSFDDQILNGRHDIMYPIDWTAVELVKTNLRALAIGWAQEVGINV